ncbi:MAG: RNase adapter RapZ [Alphaproteobacteria bacterium]|nr:RNase adapter RapZ [Alphaproteobacteria bacterium]
MQQLRPQARSKPHIILLTGMSGAGKSQALKALEDVGYEAIDNIPLNLLPIVAGQTDAAERIVLGVDVRSRNFSPEKLFASLDTWREGDSREVTLVFLECDDVILQRRFTETRRKHPVAKDRPVEDGIRLERELLAPVRKEADIIMNTSDFSVHDLKRYIRDHFASEVGEMLVFVTSFSFREGVPRDADMVLDVRFLQNPHWEESLRPMTGKDAPVAKYIKADKDFPAFFDNVCGLVKPLLPRYLEEGKSYFTIAIGCTGGRHRSVFITENLAGYLAELGYKVGVRHRNLQE